MKTLIIMRHAKACYGPTDHARPLTDHGRSQARFVGGELSRIAGVIDHVLVSDATRTRQTLEALTSGGLRVKERSIEPSLYSAGGDDLVDLLRVVANESVVMVLGHEPTMSDVAYELWNAVGDAGFSSFPTAGAAIFTFDGEWADLAPRSLTLTRFIRPPRQARSEGNRG
ncbi:SixA phosphatase family protein [Trueperella pecoris]|uniref:SixA phosphatase family protein n=1 Tax=Trueperella pecoris TaxID=2733571 RepID=UPI001ABDDFA5|nr:histidine phosphatase family protein [Trueperella pecoris]QTG74662.1 histidine phosphatase family protein [Trueperella pecoris]